MKSTLNRHQLREQSFAILFQVWEGQCPARQVLQEWKEEHEQPDDGPAVRFVCDLVLGTLEHQTQSDEIIRAHLVNWDFDRLLSVDKHLLRLALYEMNHGGTPVNVTISEAVLLAKKFGDDNSPAFINGLLGQVAREKEAGP